MRNFVILTEDIPKLVSYEKKEDRLYILFESIPSGYRLVYNFIKENINFVGSFSEVYRIVIPYSTAYDDLADSLFYQSSARETGRVRNWPSSTSFKIVPIQYGVTAVDEKWVFLNQNRLIDYFYQGYKTEPHLFTRNIFTGLTGKSVV